MTHGRHSHDKRKQGNYVVTMLVSPEITEDVVRELLREQLDQMAEGLATARSRYTVVDDTEMYRREPDFRTPNMEHAFLRAYIASQTKQGYRVEY
jgi:hypothetical protein